MDAISWAYQELGFDTATGRSEVFEQLVMARILMTWRSTERVIWARHAPHTPSGIARNQASSPRHTANSQLNGVLQNFHFTIKKNFSIEGGLFTDSVAASKTPSQGTLEEGCE